MSKPNDNLPDYLKPWSIVKDEELEKLRRLAVIARSHIRHLLEDPQLAGVNRDGTVFRREELEYLLR